MCTSNYVEQVRTKTLSHSREKRAYEVKQNEIIKFQFIFLQRSKAKVSLKMLNKPAAIIK